jgi:drug/metabolite transporter (DMT)-like permease
MGIIGPSRTAILMTLEPLVGVAIAGLWLGEEPLPLQLVGGAAVLAAAVVLQAGPRRGPRALPEDTGEYQQVV